MQPITIDRDELKDLIREAVSKAIYLDVREVTEEKLSDKAQLLCKQAEAEFASDAALSFDAAYKQCMK